MSTIRLADNTSLRLPDDEKSLPLLPAGVLDAMAAITTAQDRLREVSADYRNQERIYAEADEADKAVIAEAEAEGKSLTLEQKLCNNALASKRVHASELETAVAEQQIQAKVAAFLDACAQAGDTVTALQTQAAQALASIHTSLDQVGEVFARWAHLDSLAAYLKAPGAKLLIQADDQRLRTAINQARLAVRIATGTTTLDDAVASGSMINLTQVVPPPQPSKVDRTEVGVLRYPAPSQ
ncbi:MAG TPA: hypothetical protein VFC19_17830 [Candidatus Limnocylindrales bacterium]|nr:hypothetical protein [Candidatus Limnocylindrales bacterium]